MTAAMIDRCHRVPAVVAALALALSIPTAARAEERGAIPDQAQLAAMRDAVARAPVLLVRGDFGLRELHHAWLDSTGVRPAREESARGPRPALFATADAPRAAAPPTIAWSQISSLATQRPRKLRGAVAGFGIGLVVGVTLASLREDSYTGDLTNLGLVVGTPAGGLVIGTILGSLSGTKVIYRAPTQEND
ncbi:MAG: hypothetical protein ACRENJ_01925 [Candidatus Eiseniibacteriota bacterium]